jgi:hypothetical protein
MIFNLNFNGFRLCFCVVVGRSFFRKKDKMDKRLNLFKINKKLIL